MQAEEIKDCNKIDHCSVKLDKKIKCIMKKEGYVNYDLEIRNLESGYTGTALAIDVKGKTEEGDKETNIFVKLVIAVEIPLYDAKKVYNRERFAYLDIFEEMYDLQERENVPVAERFKSAKAFEESNDEAIILENLLTKGFKTYSRLDIMKLEYAELVVKNLARFHGLSLALENKRPIYFEKNIKHLDCVYNFNDFFRECRQNTQEYVMQFLTDDVREKVSPLIENLVDKYPSYMNDTSCPVRTICHGDYRHSNIMAKEIGGKPTEIIAIDYQSTFYGTPVLDFIYFIFWGTDQEFRKNHLDNLKQLYHQYLGTFLSYFKIEVEEVFPKKEFEKQFTEKLDFGLMVAVFYLPHLFQPEDNVPDLIDYEEPTKGISKVGTKYVERFRGIVDDFIQWGYFNK